MAKHTPGPWELNEVPQGKRGAAGQWMIRKGVHIIAMPQHGDDEDAANARLISAAPDLLEAAKRFTDCDFDSQGRAVVRVDVDAIEALRAAVRKAEGAS